MGNSAYFPLASGLLHSYCETIPEITQNYEFQPYIFFRDKLENIIPKLKDPDVVCFSVSVWNEQLSLKVGQKLKEKYPNCLLIFGGPNVPFEAEKYFEDNTFIDVTVRGDGEEALKEILLQHLNGDEFKNIAGISYRDRETKKCIKNKKNRDLGKDLDKYPSPYLTGKFDYLFNQFPDFKFQAIIETNRGCPFLCTFCFWGQGGLSTKYRYFSIDRVKEVFEWCGKNQIEYVFNADSNFGMLKRDQQIAEILVEIKKEYGYPEKFRTCYGKNSDEKIFKIGKLFHEHGLEKSITLARQSNDSTTLDNIKRTNINLDTFKQLQLLYNEHNIPVYTEFILGLPGETYQTWVDGFDEILRTGINNQIFVYVCNLLTNTEMDYPEYREKHGLITTHIPATEIHCSIRPEEDVEIEEVVIGTNTLPISEWKKSFVFAKLVILMHSMKIGFYIIIFLHHHYKVSYKGMLDFLISKHHNYKDTLLGKEIEFFFKRAEEVTGGSGRGCAYPEFGDIAFDDEEVSFLRLSKNKDRFYKELELVVLDLLNEQQLTGVDPNLVGEVIGYQCLRVVDPTRSIEDKQFVFEFNVPEYFDNILVDDKFQIKRSVQHLRVLNIENYNGDKKRFMQERLLFGRKSGTMLLEVAWSDNKDPKWSVSDRNVDYNPKYH